MNQTIGITYRKKIDKTGGHQTSQERLLFLCTTHPPLLRGFIFPPPHRSLRTLADSHCEPRIFLAFALGFEIKPALLPYIFIQL